MRLPRGGRVALYADPAGPDRVVLPVRLLEREVGGLGASRSVERARGDGVRTGRERVDVERPEGPGVRVALGVEPRRLPGAAVDLYLDPIERRPVAPGGAEDLKRPAR